MELGISLSGWCERLKESPAQCFDSGCRHGVQRDAMLRIPTGMPAWRRRWRRVANSAVKPTANVYLPVGAVPVMTEKAQRAPAALVRIDGMSARLASIDLRYASITKLRASAISVYNLTSP